MQSHVTSTESGKIILQNYALASVIVRGLGEICHITSVFGKTNETI